MVLFKRSGFWLSFALFSCGAAFFSYRYLDKVYSLVNLAITSDRHQILADAKLLASQLSWDISDYQNVTAFESQDDLQCFVELEAGGKNIFVDMFESGTYYPYHWHVRFFKEKQVVEMHAWFSPDGKRLGFAQKLSEQSSGAALSKEQAQQLVESKITTWCPNFDQYKIIEYDSEIRDTGRVDHDFTYERTDVTIGQGFYRFKAVVCGNVVTRLEPFVKIPDNFLRRYQQMRSANNLLASVGSFFFRSLYLIFFGLLGLILFYRRNYLLGKKSALAAAIVAGGMFARGLNEYPLWWSSYNTVQATSTFVLMKLFEQIVTFIYLFGMIFLTVIVAEAAGRWIYKKHVQLFKNFSYPSFRSFELAQQILFAYLMVPFMFAYVVAFGYLTKTYFGWWSPAGSLFDPNVVACYFPWLSAIAISLQAGFFEEVVCRALPLAMAAVLTKDSKHKKLWFISIFVLQALIFGACHANYPNQPSYARIIELVLPSFGFGWIYLYFGLLPGVITHFVYDVVWFAMPIFTSNLFWSKIIVILLAGLPLWIVCGLYLYHRKFTILPEDALNESFLQPEVIETVVQPRLIGKDIPARNIKMLMIAAVVSFIVWATTYQFRPDVAPLRVAKAQAIERSRQEIAEKFHAQLDASWTPVVIVQDDCSTTATRFIWQVYGKEIYDLAIGSYLTGINWLVRFVQFSGAVEERGQEYVVVVATNHEQHPHVMKAEHIVPEHFAGADIDEQQALAIVYDFVAQQYLLEQQDLKLISVNSDKLVNRRDWTIILQDTQIFDFQFEGQARIKVKICGDQLSDYSRFIFVPEDWTRADQAKMMNLNLVKTGLWFLFFLLMALGLACGVKILFRSRLGMQMIRHKGLFVATVSMIYTINGFSVFIGHFNTAEPFYDQLTRLSLGLVTKLSYQVLFCSIFLAIGAVGFIKGKKSNFIHSLMISIAAGLILMGTSSLLNFFQPLFQPICGSYSPAGHYLPILAFAGDYIKILYLFAASIMAMFVVLTTVHHRWPHRLWVQILVAVLFCLSLEAVQTVSSIPWMLLHGFFMGCIVYFIFYLVLQYDMTRIPLVVATVVTSMIVPEIIYSSYVGAAEHVIVAVGMIWSVAYYFYERAHQE